MSGKFMKVWVAVLCAGFVVTHLSAREHQRPQGPPRIPDSAQILKMVNELTLTLSLTDDQKTRITDLFVAHFEEVGKLMKQGNGDRRQHHQMMESRRREFEEKVISLLTDDQKIKFKKFMQSRGRRPEPRRPER